MNEGDVAFPRNEEVFYRQLRAITKYKIQVVV